MVQHDLRKQENKEYNQSQQQIRLYGVIGAPNGYHKCSDSAVYHQTDPANKAGAI